ncbi:endonuclease/exonuclease/phosphatase family protein [Henriciella litoralis]|uniref:endonuclease/exonuclease/phosphatase family protein n=1 Tax=Henriciella litoralis TaxID=568102 RepID=UPI0009FC3CCE|nr:endonuclease/exonuclease/phosphatase family protein [Henriciella litoralis]
MLVIGFAAIIIAAQRSETFWLFDLLGQFQLAALWGLLGATAFMLVPAFFSSSQRSYGLVIGFGLIILAIGWLSVRAPLDAPSLKDGPAIKVFQHNVWASNPDPSQVVTAALGSGADIAALIEYENESYAPFEDRLSARWPSSIQGDARDRGNIRLRLMTRFPVVDSETRRPDQGPAYLRARLATPDGELTVIVVHFTRPWPFAPRYAQISQLESLQTELARIKGPVVLLGDFNSAAWGRIAKPLKGESKFQLINNPAVGTWPGRLRDRQTADTLDWPRALSIPIDLTFCRGPVICANHKVGSANGSDHRAVTFELQLTDR